MSQIHYEKISLAEVVKRSPLVLVVKAAAPAERQEQVPIGKDQKGQEAPSFVRVLQRCEVLGALSVAGSELVGKTIEIDAANWRSALASHQRYCLEGLSRSPIYSLYEPSAPPTAAEQKGAPFIVFLRSPAEGEFAFVVQGGSERIKQRAAIEKLIGAKKSPR